MRVLLYDVRTKRYFQSPGSWTRDPNLAQDFRGNVNAVMHAFQKKLADVAVIFAFEDPNLNLQLPLPVTR